MARLVLRGGKTHWLRGISFTGACPTKPPSTDSLDESTLGDEAMGGAAAGCVCALRRGTGLLAYDSGISVSQYRLDGPLQIPKKQEVVRNF